MDICVIYIHIYLMKFRVFWYTVLYQYSMYTYPPTPQKKKKNRNTENKITHADILILEEMQYQCTVAGFYSMYQIKHQVFIRANIRLYEARCI